MSFCRFQRSAAANLWNQDPVGTMLLSGIMTPQQTPALSSGLADVKEMITSLRLKEAAKKPVSRSNKTQTRLHSCLLLKAVSFVVVAAQPLQCVKNAL